MTIQDAKRDGISRIRKPYWNHTAFLELPPKFEDGFGPWCELHDLGTVQKLLITQVDDGLSDWDSADESRWVVCPNCNEQITIPKVDPPTPATRT
jgi:hypothetical protein